MKGGRPRAFRTLNSANAWLAETFADWAAALTKQERLAIASYKGSGHEELNTALREDFPLDPVWERAEAEIVLPRGSRFLVRAVHRATTTRRFKTLDLEVTL
ncbi:MAG: ADP-ribosyltransferase [Thermoanaerobaculia bacterium]